MRIFIHNVDSFLGKAMVKELRRADGGGLNRIFGTAGKAEDAPSSVKRVVSRDDPKKAKKMAETMSSCRVVIMDLFNCSLEDLHFAINALKVDPKSSPPKVTGELEGDVTFILVSSVKVWAATEREAGAILKDSDYLRRTPVAGTKFEHWKEMEDLMFNCFNREESKVKGFVVSGGVLYGEGEYSLAQMFKDAWRGEKVHQVLGSGTNRVPMVHARDLIRLIRQVALTSDNINPLESTPFFLAADQPPAPEGEPSVPPTQADIVQGIVDAMGEHYEVPRVSDVSAYDNPDVTEREKDLFTSMTLDLCIEPSAIMLGEEFCASAEPPGWICKDGFLANLGTICDEFCAGNKLRAMKILIAGPPSSGKTALAQAVAEHYKQGFQIPSLTLKPNAEQPDLESMVQQLSSNVCRYRGYVLDAGIIGFEEAEKLFRFDVEVPKTEEEEPPADGEDAEPSPPKIERRLNEETAPTFVIVTQAPQGLCKAKWQATGSVGDFDAQMKSYVASNLTEDDHSLSDFFQDVVNIGVFNLPVAGKDEEELFESTRIYLESQGRPFNYLPTEDEVAKEIREQRAMKLAKAAEEEAAASQKKDTGKGKLLEEEKRHEERLKIIAQHEADHKKLEDMALREYLMSYMVPSLTEGLIEVCKVLPDNPVDYLANYIEEHVSKKEPAQQ